MNKKFNMDAEMQNDSDTYLSPNNKRLLDLIQRYSNLSVPAVNPSRWSRDYISEEVSLSSFRGDCAYVWQHRDGNEEYHYILSALYTQSIDTLGLFDLLNEDTLFGAQIYNYDDRYVLSRDFLDSINEILFLERHLGLSTREQFSVVDIGAGYGRLAHRMAEALPKMDNIFCVDAIPESTFISEYYLNYRGVSDKAHVVPLYNIEEELSKNNVLLATNIHSFSECALESINWWLDLLVCNSVKYLMIEPNAGNCAGKKLVSFEPDNTRLDYFKTIESKGYTLIAKEPTYKNSSVQKLGVSPTYYYLFELR